MKHYDKIFLIVAIMILCASGAFYHLNKSTISATKSDTDKILALDPKGEKWQNKDISISAEEALEWPAVKPQDDRGLWLFQVFTPPKIWLDSKGNFIAEPPYKTEGEKKAFNLIFGEIVTAIYPIRYSGYTPPFISLTDTRNNAVYMGKINEEITKEVLDNGAAKKMAMGLIIRSFNTKRELDKTQNVYIDYVTITIEDKNLGKTVTIYSDKPTPLPDERLMLIKSSSDAKFKWTFKSVGESITSGSFKYTVKEMDMDKEYAVIDQYKDGALVKTVKVSASGNTNIFPQE